MASGIKVTIDLDETQAVKALKSLNAQLDKTEKNTKETFTTMDQAFASMLGNLAAIAASKAFDTLRQEVIASFNAFSDFEAGLISVAKTANLTQSEIDVLSENILKLSEEIPASTAELLDIATAAGQLGVTGTKDITLFTDTIAKLGRVSDVSGDAAATSLTRILNVTRENIDTVDTFASVIVSLGNNFAATESEIIAVTNEVARATAQFGVSAADAAALSTALRAVGVRAEEAGGVLSKAFVKINEAIQEGGEPMNKLIELTGKTSEEIKKAFSEDATGFFRDFVNSLNNAEGGLAGASKNLAALGIEGIRVQKVIPVLAANISEFDRALALANAETQNATALNEEFGKTLASTQSQTTLFGNAIERARIRLGENLADAFKEVLPYLTEFVNKIGKSKVEIFADSTEDVAKLNKELQIYKDKLKAVENSSLPSIFKADPDELKENIKVISDRIKELGEQDASKTLAALKQELEFLNKELTVTDPLLGVNSIFGSEQELTTRKQFIEEQIKNIESMAIESSNKVTEVRNSNTEKEKAKLSEKEQFMKDFEAVRAEEAALKAEEEQLMKELKDEEDFQYLQEQLGKENAAREIARINDIEDDRKRRAAYTKLREKAKAEEKKKNKMLEEQEKANRISTINTLASMETGSSKELFHIKQAAAIASAYMNTSEAVTKALSLGPILGPIAAIAIGASGAIQIANIQRQKPPSGGRFQDGGIVGGSSFSGDNISAQVNSGEMIFNRRQQENLFNAVDSGSLGGGTNITINSQSLTGEIPQESIDSVIDQLNDRSEFGNKELRA